MLFSAEILLLLAIRFSLLHFRISIFYFIQAAIAQLGERQTEDLKVPGSIPGLGKNGLATIPADTRQVVPLWAATPVPGLRGKTCRPSRIAPKPR